MVAAMAGAGVAGAAASVAYRGSTSQRHPVSLKVSAGAVPDLKILVADRCPDGHKLLVHANFPAMPINHGKFGGKFRPAGAHRGEKATLNGTVGRDKVTGSLRDVGYSSREHRLCHGSTRFTARRV